MRIILNRCKDNDLQAFAPVLQTARLAPNPAPCKARRLRIALGTFVAVETTSISTCAAETAVEAAFAALSEVQRRMHPRSAGSDLSRINTAPLGTAVPVHPSTTHLLNLARRLHLLTGGAFDPCLPSRPGRLTDLEINSRCEITSRPEVTSPEVTSPEVISPEVICHAPIALDFGGFAKGYAVDCAIEALMTHGCQSGLVNAGGDLRVFGPTHEPTFIRGPDGELREVTLSNAALAVSHASSTQPPAEHQGYYNRTTGNADTALITPYAAVVAAEGVIADALAKCVLLCQSDIAATVLREFNATLLVDQ